MANSFNQYVANGTQTAFTVTFDQTDWTEIRVYLNDIETASGWSYNSVNKTVVFSTAPAAGTLVRLQRYTDLTLINKFGQGAAFTGQNLDENFEQILFKSEETQEAQLGPLDRALRVPANEASINPIPARSERLGGKFLGFDTASGQPIVLPLAVVEDSALATALAMSDGGKYIGTVAGGTFLNRQDVVCLSEFTESPQYTGVSEAVNACFEYARVNGKVVDARGWDGTLDGDITMTDIEVVGGTWRGTSEVFIVNSLFRNFFVTNLRLKPWGGDVRIRNGKIDGNPGGFKVANIGISDIPTDGCTIEVSDVEFRNGLYGILQQGTGGTVVSGVYRNLSFYNMGGDCIELNVVARHYDEGCMIENIFIENVDSTEAAPIPNSNWGIGIGIAGNGPYGIDSPDSAYAKNVTIRNVTANKCRQIIHFELVRDSIIENVHGDPDQSVSVGAGLAVATVFCYGSRRIKIDGISGEPVTTGSTLAEDVRVVSLEWGANPELGAVGPCHDVSVRNVMTRTGRVYAGIGVEKEGYTNTYELENITCAKLSLFGVATSITMANVSCRVFDCVGDDSAAGTSSNGYRARGQTILRMTNVNAVDENGYGGQGWSRPSYSHIEAVGSNVYARTYPPNGIDGGMGVRLSPAGSVYIIPDADTMNYANWDGNAFPTGREFAEGDLLIRNDGKIFIVTSSGAYIPATADFQIEATNVGDSYIESAVEYDGTKASLPWIYRQPLTPGTRITIPGAGASGSDLQTWITDGPYHTNTGVPSSPVRVNIAHQIQTATAAGTQLAATYPIAFRTPS